MISKQVSYTDYNGNERKETYYFHLTKAELSEMALSTEGGLETMIKRIIETENVQEIVRMFKEILIKSYGEKSVDGKSFFKMDENGNPLSRKFVQTEAYSQLFMELSQDPKVASEFIKGVLPADLASQVPDDPEQLVLTMGVTK